MFDERKVHIFKNTQIQKSKYKLIENRGSSKRNGKQIACVMKHIMMLANIYG